MKDKDGFTTHEIGGYKVHFKAFEPNKKATIKVPESLTDEQLEEFIKLLESDGFRKY